MWHTVSQYSESLKSNVCLCVTVYNVRVQLLVCMSVCLRDCVPFRIIIMCTQIVHVCLYNYVHYALLGSGVLIYVLSLCYVC